MNKDKLENELATAILYVMMKHIETGYNDKGFGEFFECKIDFKYLHNKGAALVRDLNLNSNVSDYVEP